MPVNNTLRKICDDLQPFLKPYMLEKGLWDGHSKMFRCPHHLDKDNPHEDRTPSATFTEDGEHYVCYGCERKGDIIDLAKFIENFEGEKVWIKTVNFLKTKYLGGGLELALDSNTPNTGSTLPCVHTNLDPFDPRTAMAERPRPVIKQPKKKKYRGPKYYVHEPTCYTGKLEAEGRRIIQAGYGVVVFRHTKTEKGPTKAPFYDVDQTNGAANPITDEIKMINTIRRCLTSVDDREENVSLGISLQNLICVDVDMHGTNNGLRNLRGLELALDVDLPQGIWEYTPSGGRHFFFKKPAGMDVLGKDAFVAKYSKVMDVSGIDILTGNRAVIVPPSYGYFQFDGLGIKSCKQRNWHKVPFLPDKWSDLLSLDGPEARELLHPEKMNYAKQREF